MRKKYWFSIILVAGVLSACEAQNKEPNMNEEQKNPLICDPLEGICGIPGASETQGKVPPHSKKPLTLVYFTDPICSACWSIEPQLRKLMMEYGAYFTLRYHMGGLLPSWEGFNGGGITKPSDVAHHWEEMSSHFDMPIDGDVWLTDPLNSSYPACIAFKAAELQGSAHAAQFLRRIREMVFLEKKNIARWENLQAAAFETGLDTARLADDYKGAAVENFRGDLALAARFGVRGFPAIFITDSLQNQLTIYGFRPYDDFEQAIRKLVPDAKKNAYNVKDDHLFSHFTTLTDKEFSVLANITKEQATGRLNELLQQGRIEKQPGKNGTLWKKKARRQAGN